MKRILLLLAVLTPSLSYALPSVEKLVEMAGAGILLHCDGDNQCTDINSGETYEPLDRIYPKGLSLVFPPERYTAEEVAEAAPYIVQYYRKLGLIKE